MPTALPASLLFLTLGHPRTPAPCICIHSFIHLGYFIAPLQVHFYSTDTMSEFHAEAPQPTASERLVQGPYVASRAGFEETSGRQLSTLPMRHHIPYALCNAI